MRSPLIPFLYFLYLDQRNRAYISSNEYFSVNDIVKLANLYLVPVDSELKTYLELKEILVNNGLTRLVDEIYSNPLKYSEIITSPRQATVNNTLAKILETKKKIGDFFLERRRIIDAWNTYSSIVEWMLSYILKRYVSIIDGLRALAEIIGAKELVIPDHPLCLPGKPCSVEELVEELDIDVVSSLVDQVLKNDFLVGSPHNLPAIINRIEKNRIKRIVAERLGIEDPIVVMSPLDIEEITSSSLAENKIIIYNNLNNQVNKIVENLALVGGIRKYNLIPLYSIKDNYSVEKLLRESASEDINEIEITPATILNSLEQAIRILPIKFSSNIHVKLLDNQLSITYSNKEIDVVRLAENIRKELGQKIPVEKNIVVGMYVVAKTILY